jgi:hypothetical protein
MLEEGIWVVAAGVNAGKVLLWSPPLASYRASPVQSLYHGLRKITLLYNFEEKIHAISNHTSYPRTALYLRKCTHH